MDNEDRNLFNLYLLYWFRASTYSKMMLGTKNKNLEYDADGSLTLYAGAKSPSVDKESNWLPAPKGTFSLCFDAFWAEPAVLDGKWQPPRACGFRLTKRQGLPMIE